jgi:hypothetical protein
LLNPIPPSQTIQLPDDPGRPASEGAKIQYWAIISRYYKHFGAILSFWTNLPKKNLVFGIQL